MCAVISILANAFCKLSERIRKKAPIEQPWETETEVAPLSPTGLH